MNATLANAATAGGRLGTTVVGNGVTTALIVAVVNALFGVALAFGVHVSDAQLGSIDIALNTILALWSRVAHVAAKQKAVSAPPAEDATRQTS
jgi:hypothetical protein